MFEMRRDRLFNVVICIFLSVTLFSSPWEALAGEMTLVPSIDLTARYDDNIYYTREDKESDYAATVKPGFELNYKSELYTLRSRGYVDLIRYLDNSNLNRENYYALLDGDASLTERMRLKGNFSFINDTTLDSQLDETGLVTTRTDRKKYNGGGELTYRVTQRSTVGMSYNRQAVRYGSDLYNDYDYDYAGLVYGFSFNAGLDQLTLNPYYGDWRSDMSSVHNYGFSLGILHTFSETFTLEGSVGVRYTETERNYKTGEIAFDPDTGTFSIAEKEEKRKDSDWGGTAAIQLKKTWIRSSLTAGYSRELTYSSGDGNAEPVDVDRVFCSVEHKITPRFRAGLAGSFYITKSESEFGDEDTRYISLTPSLRYDITRNFSLGLAYSYTRETDQSLDDNPAWERNRVWLTFSARFL